MKNNETKKTKGKTFEKILGRLKSVYKKYTLNVCPSSLTISRKFTACITQIIREILIETTIKNSVKSLKNFQIINFFIEI